MLFDPFSPIVLSEPLRILSELHSAVAIYAANSASIGRAKLGNRYRHSAGVSICNLNVYVQGRCVAANTHDPKPCLVG